MCWNIAALSIVLSPLWTADLTAEAGRQDPIGKVVARIPVRDTYNLAWSEESDALIIQTQPGKALVYDAFGKFVSERSVPGIVLSRTAAGFVVFTQEKGIVQEVPDSGPPVASQIRLPGSTVRIPFWSARDRVFVAVVAESEILQQVVLQGFDGKVKYRSQYTGRVEVVWDASFSSKFEVLLISRNGYGWVETVDFGVEVVRVDEKRTIWDPAPLDVTDTASFVKLLPPTQTVFVGGSRILRYVIETLPGFKEEAQKRSAGYPANPYSRHLPPNALKHTRLAIWTAGFDFDLDAILLRLDSKLPPRRTAVSPEGKRVAFAFADEVIIATF